MKIIVNATNLKQGGALQITRSVLEQFKAKAEHEYHVFLSPQLKGIINTTNFATNFHFYNFNTNPTNSIFTSLTFQSKLSALERKIKPDFVLSIFGPAMWKPKAPHLLGFANGLYLFDNSRFIQELWLKTYFKRCYYYLRRYLLLKKVKEEATLLWTETDHSRKTLSRELDFPENKIFVVSNTYGEQYGHSSDIEGIRSGGSYKFLYLTADYPHKNLEVFNKILPLIHERKIDCIFYLTLSPEVFAQRFPRHLNDPKLVNLGPLTPDECVGAYKKVDALFFPSFIETFSANYPEAMVMQKPIITSDLDFAHDICGDAALYFDPFDPTSIIQTIENLMNKPQLQKELIQNGLIRLQSFDSASQRAEKLLKIMKDYLNRNR